jgi:iron complex transport system permease protein
MTPRGQTVLLLLVAAAIALVSISIGSVDIAVGKVFTSLISSTGDPEALVIRELRLPRMLTAFTVGALLAVAGALLQVLLRNPLADPYILGVSGGAAHRRYYRRWLGCIDQPVVIHQQRAPGTRHVVLADG